MKKKTDKDIEIEEQEREINILLEENAELRRLLKKLKCCFNCDTFSQCQITLGENKSQHHKECKKNDLIYWKEKKRKIGKMNV